MTARVALTGVGLAGTGTLKGKTLVRRNQYPYKLYDGHSSLGVIYELGVVCFSVGIHRFAMGLRMD